MAAAADFNKFFDDHIWPNSMQIDKFIAENKNKKEEKSEEDEEEEEEEDDSGN